MNEKIIEKVEVRSINDIRKIIQPFYEESVITKTDLKTDIVWQNDEGKTPITFKTSVNSYVEDANIKTIIIDAFKALIDQQKMLDHIADALEDDEYGPTLPRTNISKIHSSVDNFIKRRMGGVREGLTIVWNLNGIKWVFDPFTKTLTESKEQNA